MKALEIGSRRALRVRREDVEPAGATAAGAWRLLYASDLHLTARRAHVVEHLRAAAAITAPDAVLLGGDCLDRRTGLGLLERCVTELGQAAPVFAVPGNHDRWFGLDRVRAAVTEAGGRWLPDGSATLQRAGRRPLHLHGTLSAERADDGIHVLVAHHPGVFPRAAGSGCSLVVAGHLHGGQCVLWRHGGREYPGAFLSRWNGPRFEWAGATLVVSRGVADTLPIRFRCPREVLLCRIR